MGQSRREKVFRERLSFEELNLPINHYSWFFFVVVFLIDSMYVILLSLFSCRNIPLFIVIYTGICIVCINPKYSVILTLTISYYTNQPHLYTQNEKASHDKKKTFFYFPKTFPCSVCNNTEAILKGKFFIFYFWKCIKEIFSFLKIKTLTLWFIVAQK